MTNTITRGVRQALPLFALALFIKVPGIAHADTGGLAQMQAVLAGKPDAAAASVTGAHGIQVKGDLTDAQELARRSVVGHLDTLVQAGSVRTDSEPRRAALLAREDAQALARQALVGPRHLTPAGS